jgi:hypothetical protein
MARQTNVALADLTMENVSLKQRLAVTLSLITAATISLAVVYLAAATSLATIKVTTALLHFVATRPAQL